MSQSRSQANTEVVTGILDLGYELVVRKPKSNPILIAIGIDNLFEVIDKHISKETQEEKKRALQANLINLKTSAGYSAIYYAVKMGNFKLFEKLVNKGANLEGKYDGLTLQEIIHQELVRNPKNKEYQNINKALNGKSNDLKNQITNEEKSTQSWIQNPLHQKGYQQSEGFCFGVAHMGAQAFLLSDRDKNNNLVNLNDFASRVAHLEKNSETIVEDIEISRHKRIILVNQAKNLLYHDKPDGFKLPLKEEQIEIEKIISDRNYRSQLAKNQVYEKRKKEGKVEPLSAEEEINEITKIIGINRGQLNENDKINLEMDPFFNGVEVYQQIWKHTDLASEKLNAQSFLPGMDLVPNLALEKEGGAVTVDYFSDNYTQKELDALFSRIEEIAKKAKEEAKYDSPIVLVLAVNNHRITIGYDPVKEKWRNIDANCPARLHKEYSSSDIARVVQHELATCFGKESPENLKIHVLSTAANAANTKQKIITPLHQSQEWKSKHGFFVKNKNAIIKNTLYAVGGIFLGAAFIAASFFTAGILPAVVTGVLVGVGAFSAGAGFTPTITSVFLEKSPEKNLKTSFEKHLKTSADAYKNNQKQEEKKLLNPSTTMIAKHMDIKQPHQEKEKISTPAIELAKIETKTSKVHTPAIELSNTKEEENSHSHYRIR